MTGRDGELQHNDRYAVDGEIKPDGWLNRNGVMRLIESSDDLPGAVIDQIDAAFNAWHERSQKRADEVAALRAERDELRAALRGLVRGMAEVAPAQREAIRVLATIAGREEEAKADG